MDKEKILEQYNKSTADEGLNYVQNKGLSLGYLLFIILSTIIIAVNLYRGHNSFSIFSLLFGFIAADSYSRYKFSKKKIHILVIIGSLVGCIAYLAKHILYLFG